MAHVSIILPVAGTRLDWTWVETCRNGVEAAGHDVEILVAGKRPEGRPGPEGAPPGLAWRWVESCTPGLAPAAMAGMAEAQGEASLVVDTGMGYAPEGLDRLLEPLLTGEAEVVVGSRLTPERRGLRAAVGRLLRSWFGTSDPLSGVVGLTRDAYHEAASGFLAVGSKFSFEILAKVDGRIADRPVRRTGPRRRDWPRWDDIRHWKRLADYRFGNFSRLVQFCTVGASGMVVDLSSYALFQWIFSHTELAHRTTPWVGGPMHLAAAAVVAIGLALVWNFTLNRRLTFNDARGGSIVRQFFTYVLSNAVSVPLSFFLRLRLPQWLPFFNRHRLAAAVVGIVAGTAVSFSMARWLVFRRQPPPPAGPSKNLPANHPEAQSPVASASVPSIE